MKTATEKTNAILEQIEREKKICKCNTGAYCHACDNLIPRIDLDAETREQKQTRWNAEEAHGSAIIENIHRSLKVGDGVTLCLYTDCYACTVIAKKGTVLTLQRDNATLLTKPEFVPGGFAAHCTNNDDMKYSYAPNANGTIYKARWARSRGRWNVKGFKSVSAGRNEKYDYNF